jgi:hypothetical protein
LAERGFEILRMDTKDGSAAEPNAYAFVNNAPIDELDPLGLVTVAECDAEKEICDDGCRNIKGNSRKARMKRALCWAKCTSELAACYALTTQGLVIIGGTVVVGICIVVAPEVTIPVLILAPK